jgi:hypothetical protein
MIAVKHEQPIIGQAICGDRELCITLFAKELFERVELVPVSGPECAIPLFDLKDRHVTGKQPMQEMGINPASAEPKTCERIAQLSATLQAHHLHRPAVPPECSPVEVHANLGKQLLKLRRR